MFRMGLVRGALSALAAVCVFSSTNLRADTLALQNATATFSQGSYSVVNTSDLLYPTNDAANVGWANDNGGATNANVAVWETVNNLNFTNGGALRFNLVQGGFGSGNHNIGRYRISYTTDNRATFADGLANGGAVTANWTVITPTSAQSLGSNANATLTVQGDGSILASGTSPTYSTDTVYANIGPVAAPITGFRLEAMLDGSLPTSGPGRATNGNYMLREFGAAAFPGQQKISLQNGTALRSQGGFSVDNILDGGISYRSDANAGEGWANNAQGNNAATFETSANTPGTYGRNLTKLAIDITSGGFATHTLGKFRIAGTTADRSLFADGNDNGGATVGTEPIWTTLTPDSITSDQAGVTFTVDSTGAILVGGSNPEFATYTLNFTTPIVGFTGFRLEALTDATLPGTNGGPGRGANGNFVVRELQAFVLADVPEPTAVLSGSLVLVAGAIGAVMNRRRNARKSK